MTVGVVMMAYGTPASKREVLDYYTHIRGGRAPSDEQLADLVRRYEEIGGLSPLAARTRDQREAIAHALDRRVPGQYQVAVGNKHASPFVEDAVEFLEHGGCDEIVGLVMAPHHSEASVGEYHERAAAVADVDYRPIDRWYDLPEFVEHQASTLREVLVRVGSDATVRFTAHSLPLRALEGDHYVDELRRGATEIASVAGLADGRWDLGWQSAGRTPEEWAGPDVLEEMRALASDGVERLVVVPHGFVADHLEVLYDLDVDAATLADELGMAYGRTQVVNDDPHVMSGLADLVIATASRGE
jgi:protoporphyrin/coproporphyrin ferrochelatase